MGVYYGRSRSVQGGEARGGLGRRGGSGWRDGREQRVRSRARAPRVFCFGKWFTEIFFVNRFPFFPSRFYGQIQMFSS